MPDSEVQRAWQEWRAQPGVCPVCNREFDNHYIVEWERCSEIIRLRTENELLRERGDEMWRALGNYLVPPYESTAHVRWGDGQTAVIGWADLVHRAVVCQDCQAGNHCNGCNPDCQCPKHPRGYCDAYTPERVPPNERTPYLLSEVIEHADENGALANATADELRDALALAAERIRELVRRWPGGVVTRPERT